MKKEITSFNLNGIEISKDTEGRISLNDLWKSAGSPKNQDPRRWAQLPQAIGFIEATREFLNDRKSDIIKSTRGAGGGTFAHRQIALAYAKYLSPELHLKVNEVFFERIEEEKNPQLAIDKGVLLYRKQGKDDNWISERLISTASRNIFTSILAKHGVTQAGFGHCTNAIYTPLFGGGANKVREKKNLPVKTNTREHMTLMELTATRFAEVLAADNIEKNGLTGNKECEYECYNSAKLVAKTIVQSRKSL